MTVALETMPRMTSDFLGAQKLTGQDFLGFGLEDMQTDGFAFPYFIDTNHSLTMGKDYMLEDGSILRVIAMDDAATRAVRYDPQKVQVNYASLTDANIAKAMYVTPQAAIVVSYK